MIEALPCARGRPAYGADDRVAPVRRLRAILRGGRDEREKLPAQTRASARLAVRTSRTGLEQVASAARTSSANAGPGRAAEDTTAARLPHARRPIGASELPESTLGSSQSRKNKAHPFAHRYAAARADHRRHKKACKQAQHAFASSSEVEKKAQQKQRGGFAAFADPRVSRAPGRSARPEGRRHGGSVPRAREKAADQGPARRPRRGWRGPDGVGQEHQDKGRKLPPLTAGSSKSSSRASSPTHWARSGRGRFTGSMRRQEAMPGASLRDGFALGFAAISCYRDGSGRRASPTGRQSRRRDTGRRRRRRGGERVQQRPRARVRLRREDTAKQADTVRQKAFWALQRLGRTPGRMTATSVYVRPRRRLRVRRRPASDRRQRARRGRSPPQEATGVGGASQADGALEAGADQRRQVVSASPRPRNSAGSASTSSASRLKDPRALIGSFRAHGRSIDGQEGTGHRRRRRWDRHRDRAAAHGRRRRRGGRGRRPAEGGSGGRGARRRRRASHRARRRLRRREVVEGFVATTAGELGGFDVLVTVVAGRVAFVPAVPLHEMRDEVGSSSSTSTSTTSRARYARRSARSSSRGPRTIVSVGSVTGSWAPRTRRLQRGEGRTAEPGADGRRGVRALRHPHERPGVRWHRDPGDHRSRRLDGDRRGAAGTARERRGGRGCRALPRLSAVVLCHRPGAGGRWRRHGAGPFPTPAVD